MADKDLLYQATARILAFWLLHGADDLREDLLRNQVVEPPVWKARLKPLLDALNHDSSQPDITNVATLLNLKDSQVIDYWRKAELAKPLVSAVWILNQFDQCPPDNLVNAMIVAVKKELGV